MILAQAVPSAPDLVPSVPSAPGPATPATNPVGGSLQPFLESELFDMVQALGSLTGTVLVVAIVFFVIRNITQGMLGMAVRTGVFGAVVAAMLFNLRAPIAFAQGLTGLVEQVFSFLLGLLQRTGGG